MRNEEEGSKRFLTSTINMNSLIRIFNLEADDEDRGSPIKREPGHLDAAT